MIKFKVKSAKFKIMESRRAGHSNFSSLILHFEFLHHMQCDAQVWALPFSLAATKGINNCSLFLRVLRCFTSPSILSKLTFGIFSSSLKGFPHSEIFGSKLARQLPEAYRRHATSFIASFESRHPSYALTFLIRKCINRSWEPKSVLSYVGYSCPVRDSSSKDEREL